MNFQFKEFGLHLGTRVHGACIRQQILDSFSQDNKIIFDFSGVETISNSFADECFAKLILIHPIELIKEKNNICGCK
ncbi:MAG: STAS-like domain-containing protein [Taibaiella sp.]|nr:STAS-like domain-containing protein [Taibaiella sp.]